MRFTYPARLRPDSTGELIVSFRDLPECLTSGAGETQALAEAADALEEAIAGRIDDAERIPVPSARRSGEHHVAVPAGTAAKAALALALRESGLSRVTLAQRLGVDEKAVRRMLDPRHRTAVHRIEAALRVLGQELVIETRAALGATGIGEDRRGPLFRSCEPGRRDALQDRAMSRLSALKMIKRRARKVGLPAEICAHSFRGTGITEYLRNGGDLEVAARIAGHESTRTTQLYNRLPEEISLDEIERIHI